MKKEVRIPFGAGRADGVDLTHTTVYELKPNNPRAIRQGWRQLDRYAKALEKQYHTGPWTKVLVTYERGW